MQNTPLLQHIFSLSDTEINNFRLWLDTPLHNTRSSLLVFWDWLVLTKTNNAVFTKKAASKILFPNQPYQEKQVRYEMSFLLKQLRQFLAWQELQKDSVQQQVYLLKSLQDRGLHKPFEKQQRKAKKLIDNLPYRNPTYYYHDYLLEAKMYEFSHQNNRETRKPLVEVTEAFSIYALSNLLKWHCNILSHKSVAELTYDTTTLIQSILSNLKQGNYKNIPAVQIYYRIYLALSTSETVHYEILKTNVLQSFKQFPIDELRDILLLTINFCIRKLNTGDTPFLREAFDWYKQGFKENILLKNKTLSRFAYNNVILIALNLAEFEWTKQFMESYKSYIPITFRHDSYYFNLALWYQYQHQYEEVLFLLQKVEFKEVLQALHAKTILLRIYYELGEIKSLESLLDSIRIYLYRHKKIGYHKAHYTKLIQYTQKLIQLNPFDKNAKQVLQKAVRAEPVLLLKSWFLKQLD